MGERLAVSFVVDRASSGMRKQLGQGTGAEVVHPSVNAFMEKHSPSCDSSTLRDVERRKGIIEVSLVGTDLVAQREWVLGDMKDQKQIREKFESELRKTLEQPFAPRVREVPMRKIA